ncbi:hypothetical protein EJ06DRAFT_424391 [Trichodelitschia bisporula]|uniref:Uncharacterized protein n=1 Tax=Trichodelitschia bisporula TaxID=703511 RepID=A0A6G1HW85_9PEZI|nr:hypothetical protein EJ06DRAFT_424391 [Trichodelitschia bisporula]
MEAALRWSPHSTPQSPLFLLVDVGDARLRLCELESLKGNEPVYKQLCHRSGLPGYTAFDWSKTEPYLVAVGGQSGDAHLINIDPEKPPQEEFMSSFSIRHQRKCNSIAFSFKNYLATGLDRVRNDWCMNIYDLNVLSSSGVRQQEPYRKFATSDPISSIKFFSSQPEVLVAGASRQFLRIYDLRDSGATGSSQFHTRQVNNLAIDPMDENYFISAGASNEPVVSVWDRRFASKSNPSAPSTDPAPTPVLELRPAVDSSHSTAIWSLRFSGVKRGCFGILSNTGEVKIVELAQHTQSEGPTPRNSQGGLPWDSRHYTKATHNLKYPWYDRHHGQDEDTRVIAYDFISAGSPVKGQSALALHMNRSNPSNRRIEFLKIPDIPHNVKVTARNELWLFKGRGKVIQPRAEHGTVADELLAIQAKAEAVGRRRSSEQSLNQTADRLNKLSLENFQHNAPPSYETPLYPSSGDEHKDLLSLRFPDFVPSLGDALKVLGVQRRRCAEGYLLDPQRNKEVVANDRWLVDMWDTIKRFEEMAKDGGMASDELDLSYLGVYAVWNSTLGLHRNRVLKTSGSYSKTDFADALQSIATMKGFPDFEGYRTKFPAHRQLCLAICGWTFSKERVRTKCRDLMERGEIYKAIVISVMRGFKDLAQELLKSAIQQKVLQNIGLGAVIACETVGEGQRELCEWMAEETSDPYLKALLNYFIKGDWKIVADMPQLALSDRVGVALKYLDDKRLSDFLKVHEHNAILLGDIEGLVLTGLTDRAMDLFSNYTKKSNDLQTAVLAMCFTNPLYLDDPRFDMWKTTYCMQMQAWRAFPERTKFLNAHARKSVARDGRRFGHTATHPAALRCAHCLSILARHPIKEASDGSGAIATTSAPKPPHRLAAASHTGLLCPTCGRGMPRCGICGLLLGAPDPKIMGLAAAEKLAEEDGVARQVVYCMTCGHGCHGHHARDWFARHKVCPVPDCQCMCGLLH